MEDVWRIPDIKNRILFLVEQVEQLTGIKDFGIYLSKLLTIDAFFLNEDRHMHNIAVLMNGDGKAMLCPFFDHGAGLMSDTTMDYPLGNEPVDMMGDVKAKTICQNFDDALDAVEMLYGSQMHFLFDRHDVENIIAPITIYTEEEKARVETIILQQIRKYQYLFLD